MPRLAQAVEQIADSNKIAVVARINKVSIALKA
jgi:hypothetical protein